MKKRTKINWKILLLSFLFVYSAAFIGSLLTFSAVNSSWYETIKPSITPPNWVFPLVWNILFFLISLSLYLSIISVRKNSLKLKIKLSFGINLFLNVLWSLFYFALRKPAFAFIDLILLWISILPMIYFTCKTNRKSAWLLIPYLLWISFAGFLNYLSVF